MKILIAGYYGFGNLGDEMVLSAMITQIKKYYPASQLSVFSATPEMTERRHGINALPRWNFFSISKSLWAHDVLILGGGGLIQNKTSNRSLVYYLFLLALARLFQNSVVLYAIGVETVRGRMWSALIRTLLSGKKVFITVRDNESKDLLVAMGLPSQKIFVTADPVFSKLTIRRPQERFSGGPLQLLIIPRFPTPVSGTDLFERMAKILIEEKTVAVKGTLFQPDIESSFFQSQSLEMIPLVETTVFDEDPSAMSFFDGVISARFHGLVLACLSGKPFVGVGDNDKNRRLCEKFGMPYLAWDADDNEIRVALDRLFENKGKFDDSSVQDIQKSAESTLQHVFL